MIAFSAYDGLLTRVAQLEVAAALSKPVRPEKLFELIDVHCPTLGTN